MEGKRRKRYECIAEVRARHRGLGKEEYKKRREEKGTDIYTEISLEAGGLIGIRSQIKPGRLSPMMFWKESQCLCCG